MSILILTCFEKLMLFHFYMLSLLIVFAHEQVLAVSERPWAHRSSTAVSRHVCRRCASLTCLSPLLLNAYVETWNLSIVRSALLLTTVCVYVCVCVCVCVHVCLIPTVSWKYLSESCDINTLDMFRTCFACRNTCKTTCIRNTVVPILAILCPRSACAWADLTCLWGFILLTRVLLWL